MEETDGEPPQAEARFGLSNVKYSENRATGKAPMNAVGDQELAPQPRGDEERPVAPSVALVGTSFRTSNLGSRERIAQRYASSLLNLQSRDGRTIENSVLQTCNRLELYFACKDPGEVASAAVSQLAGAEIPPSCFYVMTGFDAIKHLFRVASGLDSVVTGEEQILQQVREAGKTARASGRARSILSPLFDAAYSSGKRVRESYRVSEANRSVSAFALRRALRELGRAPSRVLLMGSGETAKLAALRLKGSTVYLLSSRRDVRDRFPTAVRIPRRRLKEVASKCDLIIAATKTSKGFVLSRRDVPDKRRTVILDLGFPRNVDPSLKGSKFVHLYDLDDIAAWALSSKRDGFSLAERAAEEEARRFDAWLTASRLTPTLANIFRWAEKIRDEETAAAIRKLPDLTPHERMVVEALSKRLTGKLLSPHTSFVKEVGSSADQRERLLLLKSIFRDGNH